MYLKKESLEKERYRGIEWESEKRNKRKKKVKEETYCGRSLHTDRERECESEIESIT